MDSRDQLIIWQLEEILGVEITDEQAQKIIDARNEVLAERNSLTGVTDSEKVDTVLLAGKEEAA